MPPGGSFKAIVRQVAPSWDGRTQASTVRPVVSARDEALGTATTSLTPSKESAPPVRPATRSGPPLAVPLLPSPDLSLTVTPLASSKLNATTRLAGGGDAVWTVAAASFVAGPTFPAPSSAVTL